MERERPLLLARGDRKMQMSKRWQFNGIAEIGNSAIFEILPPRNVRRVAQAPFHLPAAWIADKESERSLLP